MSASQASDSALDQSETSEEFSSAPSISSTFSTATSSSSQKEKSSNRSSHSRSSLFHHRNHNEPRDNQTISALLAPAISVAGAHNPFVIGGMREDGSRTRRSRDSMESRDLRDEGSEDVSSRSSPKHSRRHRIRSAFGRSLSPWRFHADSEKNSEKRRSGTFSFSRLSCRDSLDVERDKKAEDKDTGTESDGESVKGGLAPRNSAFGGISDSDDSEDDEMDRENYVGSRESSRLSKERKENEEKNEAVPLESSAEKEELTDKNSNKEEDSGEESDDYIDFDEKTLDNTLFNAGCIDLHDAWLKNDGHSHKVNTPDEDRTQSVALLDDYYGPNDFDAAWEGAGPTGHDEEDETLRAPNVVIGQFNTHSPPELGGEGMEVIRNARDDKPCSKSTPPFLRAKSQQSSTSSKDTMGSSSTGHSETTDEQKDASSKDRHQLTASRPIFERNRCTITLIHGDYERLAEESKRPKRYIVASDGSEESSYAIEWTIGTVLRDGDEMLIVSVMETDTKLDSTDPKHEDKATRQEHQRIRQSMAVVLARRALAVLQRTRLAVKISCQALHARHSRHFLVEMIDFFQPTMCIVGSRGLNSLKGVLLGSFSNYCVQKSPVPVMVVRKKLKLPALPKGKGDVVSNVRKRHIGLDQAIIEKDANVAEKPEEVEKGKHGEEESEEKSNRDKEIQPELEQDGDTKGAVTEAEKVKEDALSKGIDSTSEEVKSKEDSQSTRGRAKFSIDDHADEDDRGRSRSRTSERQ